MINIFPVNGSAPDNELMRRILTPGVIGEYEKAAKGLGTSDLVCFASLNEERNTSAVTFSTRSAVLRLRPDPLFDRVKNQLTLSASEKAKQSGAPQHHGAFWLLFGTVESVEPGIAVVAAFPMASGGEA